MVHWAGQLSGPLGSFFRRKNGGKLSRDSKKIPGDLQKFWLKKCYQIDTVDGRNPAPVEVGSFSHYLQCYTSQVVKDFFRQQYVSRFGLRSITVT